MAAKRSTKSSAKAARKPAKSSAAIGKARKGFTDVERAAMNERARELKAEARASKSRAEGERAVLAAIAKLPQPDRGLGERLHAVVTASAPALSPKLWYGMPAYANEDGKVVRFFQAAQKFKTRYASFAFCDVANLDEGAMWPTGFGLKELTAAAEAKIGALVKRATSRGSPR